MELQRREKLLSGVLLGLLAVAWGVLLLPRLFRGSENGLDVFGVFRALAGLLPSKRSSSHSLGSLGRSSASGMRGVSGSFPGRSASGRSSSGRADGFSGFGLPGSASMGRGAYGVARSRRANKRRRDVFMGLLFSAIGTAVLALVPGFSMLWNAHFVIDVLLLGYVGLLVSARRPSSVRSSSMMRGAGSSNAQAAYRYEPQLDYARSEG